MGSCSEFAEELCSQESISDIKIRQIFDAMCKCDYDLTGKVCDRSHELACNVGQQEAET